LACCMTVRESQAAAVDQKALEAKFGSDRELLAELAGAAELLARLEEELAQAQDELERICQG